MADLDFSSECDCEDDMVADSTSRPKRRPGRTPASNKRQRLQNGTSRDTSPLPSTSQQLQNGTSQNAQELESDSDSADSEFADSDFEQSTSDDVVVSDASVSEANEPEVLQWYAIGFYTDEECKVQIQLPFTPPADDPYFYSDENIKLILSYYNKNKEIDVCIPDMEYNLKNWHCIDYEDHYLQFIKKIDDDLSKLKPSVKFEKFYLFGSRDTNYVEGAVFVQLSHQQDDVKIVVMSMYSALYQYDFYDRLVDAFKEKSISIIREPACEVCLALQRLEEIQWSQFVEIVSLKIENSSNVHEKIEDILKQPCMDRLEEYQKIVRNECSKNSKANQSMIDEEKVPCGEEQFNCVEVPPIWVRDLEITDPR